MRAVQLAGVGLVIWWFASSSGLVQAQFTNHAEWPITDFENTLVDLSETMSGGRRPQVHLELASGALARRPGTGHRRPYGQNPYRGYDSITNQLFCSATRSTRVSRQWSTF